MKMTIEKIENALYNYNTGLAGIPEELQEHSDLFIECNREYEEAPADAEGATKEQIERLAEIEREYAERIFEKINK